jgi:N6-L-threonylcarbamoyladenine synthase
MYVLGIESSCDETALAVVERGERNWVIAEKVKSQVLLHAKYGGVVPEIASRNHYEVIDYLTAGVLKEANLTIEDIGLISLTAGPGLIGALLVGLSFAKGLAFAHRIPLVGVDHIYSHIESAFIENPEIEYPLIALVVSGGHTAIFYQKSKFEAEVLSKTRDDALGEILDKIAKFFDLGYPGGPILDRIYKDGDSRRFKFTQPRMSDGSADFSFSGYKTAVIRHPDAQHIDTSTRIFKDLISSFLHSVVDYLLNKTTAAVDNFRVKSVVLSGGVSRNSLLRKKFTEEFAGKTVKLYLPSLHHCTDNATMVAWRGYERYIRYPDANYADFHLNSYSRAHFRESTKHR